MSSPAPRKHRRYLRFSLRTLLIATAVASALLGWRVKKVRDVDSAIIAVESAGGEIYREEAETDRVVADPGGGPPILYPSKRVWKQLTSSNRGPPSKTPTPTWNDWWRRMVHGEGPGTWRVEFKRRFTRVSDAQLDEVTARLARLDDVTELTLFRSIVGEDGLRCIARLQDLTELRLHSAPLTARGVAYLKSLPRLRLLELTVDSASEDDVDALRRAMPHCEINGRTFAPLPAK